VVVASAFDLLQLSSVTHSRYPRGGSLSDQPSVPLFVPLRI
jgi:hypothetical protein